jgi:hypothetical protein
MPPLPNKLLEAEFTLSIGSSNKKTLLQTCKNCTKYSKAKNNTRALDHLLECEPYKSKQQALALSTDTDPLQKRQRILAIPSLPLIQKRKLDIMAAKAVYMGARPFQLYEEAYMKDFIHAVSNGVYFPPSPRLIGGELLDQEYIALKNRIEVLLQSQEKLHFVLDESPNISSHRIINLSVVIPQYGSIFLANEDIGNKSLDANFFTNWFLRMVAPYDLSRVGSLTTDTCSTMRSTWNGLQHIKQLSHTLFIPCDSHGLQLLIQDLLELPQIAPIIAKAQAIVGAFHRSKKQYAILRSYQEKPQALLLSVITRWGTQFLLVSSVLRCKGVLFSWLGDKRARMGKQGSKVNILEHIITDHSFWANLSSIEQILRPIHEAQKMSESDRSTLSKVVPRWLKLEAELAQLSKILPDLIGGFTQSGGPFRERSLKQITDVHYAAWLLDPITLLKPPGQKQIDTGTQFLLARTSPEDKKIVHTSLLQFRTQADVFGPAHPASMHYDNPILYWKSYLHHAAHSALAKLAVCIFEAVANSVASERAFSAMNLIHSKLRNSLGSTKSHMLVYIYMNQRVLDRNNSILLGDPIEKTPEEQVQLEELLLQFTEQGSDGIEDDDIDIEI